MPVKNTIVYVDDDPDDQFLFREYFAQITSFDLVMFDRGHAFVSYLETNPADICLIFLDVGIPGQNGIEIYQLLRRDYPHIEAQVVFFTTAIRSDLVKAMLVEKYWVVEKPSSIGELKHVIDQCLGHKKVE